MFRLLGFWTWTDGLGGGGVGALLPGSMMMMGLGR